MESLMETISDQHDEIHQLKDRIWSQNALIHGLQLEMLNMKSEQQLKIEVQRVQLEQLQKHISEMKSKIHSNIDHLDSIVTFINDS